MTSLSDDNQADIIEAFTDYNIFPDLAVFSTYLAL